MQQQLMRAGFAPESFGTFWQTLPLEYVLRRAAAYVRPLAPLPRLLEAVGLSGLPCTYNMGQTLVMSRKARQPDDPALLDSNSAARSN